MWDILKVKKAGLFAGGVLFGTAGVKLLSSKDAKKFYTNCTAAVLRAKDSLMKTATTVQENAGDILAEAQQINEERAAKEAAEAEKKAMKEAMKAEILAELKAEGLLATAAKPGGKSKEKPEAKQDAPETNE